MNFHLSDDRMTLCCVSLEILTVFFFSLAAAAHNGILIGVADFLQRIIEALDTFVFWGIYGSFWKRLTLLFVSLLIIGISLLPLDDGTPKGITLTFGWLSLLSLATIAFLIVGSIFGGFFIFLFWFFLGTTQF